MDRKYTLGEAVLQLIENGFEIISRNTCRVIRNGSESDFEVTENNELSGEHFDNIEDAMNYAKVKLFSELYTIDEFISYYNGASRRELRDRLKTLGEHKKLPRCFAEC